MSESLGALVGWTSQNLGSRLALTLETVTTPPPHSAEDVHRHLVLLDKTQALQLAHNLNKAAGLTEPAPGKEKWLLRLLGRRR